MRKMQAEEFQQGWKYEQAKRQQRKQERSSRDLRRTGRSVWEAKPADRFDDE